MAARVGLGFAPDLAGLGVVGGGHFEEIKEVKEVKEFKEFKEIEEWGMRCKAPE